MRSSVKRSSTTDRERTGHRGVAGEVERGVDGGREGADIGRIDQPSGDAVLDVGGRATMLWRHDRQPGCHGFDDGEPELLLGAAAGVRPSRADEGAPTLARRGQQQAHLVVGPMAQQDDTLGQARVSIEELLDPAELCRLRCRGLFEIATDDDEVGSRSEAGVDGEGLDQPCHALDLVHPTDADDERKAVADLRQGADGALQVAHDGGHGARFPDDAPGAFGARQVDALGHDGVVGRAVSDVDARQLTQLGSQPCAWEQDQFACIAGEALDEVGAKPERATGIGSRERAALELAGRFGHRHGCVRVRGEAEHERVCPAPVRLTHQQGCPGRPCASARHPAGSWRGTRSGCPEWPRRPKAIR